MLDQQLPGQIAEILDRHQVPPAFMKIELTESFLVSDSGRSTGVLNAISDVGVNLSIDDFGTGYSSLSHLKRLPIQEIKIDRSFVMNMREDANDASIVHATVELGRNLGLRVVAEGVEDRETWDQLAGFGCDAVKGRLPHTSTPKEGADRSLFPDVTQVLASASALQLAASRSPGSTNAGPKLSHPLA